MRRFPPARLTAGLTSQLAPRVRRMAWRVARRHRPAGSYRFVFIVTYGRSGSTLLMSLLNTIPGYRINGENYNALYRLHQADAAISKAYEMHSDSRHLAAQGAWYGAPRMRPERFRSEVVDSFVTHVLRPEPGDRVLGFKEIRYIKSDMPDLAGFLRFLRHTFPDCKIIFNHRNIADVAQSAWWANSGKSVEKLKAADSRMRAIPDDEHHYHFSYDEIDDSLAAIRKLFAFLGEELDEPAVRRVLDVPHGPPTDYARS